MPTDKTDPTGQADSTTSPPGATSLPGTPCQPGTPPDHAGEGPGGSTGRLARWIAIVTASIVATLACWQDPGYARERLRLTVTHDGHGAITLAVADASGAPVTGVVDATLRAREFSGTALSPQPMVAGAIRGSVVAPSPLPAGEWTVHIDVTVDDTEPTSCAAALTVGPDAPPETVVCAGGTPVTAPAVHRGRGLADSRPLAITAGAVGVLVAVAMGAALLLRHRATLH